MSYSFLVTFFNSQMDYVTIMMRFFELDPYKKKYNLNIRQIKYNNVMHELHVYFFIRDLHLIYSIPLNIKSISKETNKLRDLNYLKRKKIRN